MILIITSVFAVVVVIRILNYIMGWVWVFLIQEVGWVYRPSRGHHALLSVYLPFKNL